MGEAERMLIHQALRFAVWAAGEGIAPVDGEPARDPEEFLTEYSAETDDEDWETLPERIIDALSPAPEAQQERPSEPAVTDAMELARAVLARVMTAGYPNAPGPEPEDVEKAFWALDDALKAAMEARDE